VTRSLRKSNLYSDKQFSKVLVDLLAMVLPVDEEEGLLQLGLQVVQT
jgi:hypothetical protein